VEPLLPRKKLSQQSPSTELCENLKQAYRNRRLQFLLKSRERRRIACDWKSQQPIRSGSWSSSMRYEEANTSSRRVGRGRGLQKTSSLYRSAIQQLLRSASTAKTLEPLAGAVQSCATSSSPSPVSSHLNSISSFVWPRVRVS
jgi:hypothetical protein